MWQFKESVAQGEFAPDLLLGAAVCSVCSSWYT